MMKYNIPSFEEKFLTNGILNCKIKMLCEGYEYKNIKQQKSNLIANAGNNEEECREEGEISDSSESEITPVKDNNKSTESETPPSKDTNRKLREEEFEWSKLRILMIGDERVNHFSWKEMNCFPLQIFHQTSNARVKELCEFIDKHISKSFNIVLIFAFHHDFTYFKYAYKDINLLNLVTEVNFEELINTVKEYYNRWETLYPDTKFIWTVPSAIDFCDFNLSLLEKNDPLNKKRMNEEEQHQMTRDYFSYSQILCKYWRTYLKKIPLLPLNDVLFMKKHHYRISFISKNLPLFPQGFLTSGIKPSKMMAIFLAYKLIEFLVDKNFFTNIKRLPSLNYTIDKLLQIDPSCDRYISHMRSKRKSSHHHRSSHKRRRHHSSSSESSSSSKRNHSRSRHHNHRRSDDKSEKSRKHSGSSIDSLSKGTADLEEEVQLAQHLLYLREVHDIQCNRYLQNPSSHPLYDVEKAKFLQVNKSGNWENFWKRRLEEIFAEQWKQKKNELVTDLHKKMAQTDPFIKKLNFKDEDKDSVNAYNIISENIPTTSPTLPTNITIGSLLQNSTNDRKESVQIDNSHNTFEIQKPNSSCETEVKEKMNTFNEYNNACDSDSDIDLDQLLHDPDFSIGLQEIDEELQKAGISLTEEKPEDIAKKEVICQEPKSRPPSLHSILPSPTTHSMMKSYSEICDKINKAANSSTNLYEAADIISEYIPVLKMLFRISKFLGPLGHSVTALYNSALDDIKSGRNVLNSLDYDAKVLLSLVSNKLNSLLNENLSQVQRAIYEEASERLKLLLEKLNMKIDKFPRVNIQNIASATMNQEGTRILEFITNTLLYYGYSNHTTVDLENIYRAVISMQNCRI